MKQKTLAMMFGFEQREKNPAGAVSGTTGASGALALPVCAD